MGRDECNLKCKKKPKNFNPRAPYGARHIIACLVRQLLHFNPRAPYGARPRPAPCNTVFLRISIHAPRMGRDSRGGHRHGKAAISIHAPRMGRDRRRRCSTRQASTYFNPRAPYGARLNALKDRFNDFEFQSTRPVWGATNPAAASSTPLSISIHAPRMGRDPEP